MELILAISVVTYSVWAASPLMELRRAEPERAESSRGAEPAPGIGPNGTRVSGGPRPAPSTVSHLQPARNGADG